ncbi:LamG-like jellyroll fold domain-containing protein [Streptomyces sp. E-08]|uniref:LamG domain-containing protein n=1 Tax=Streptomyces sp. E-08 TaxID=3404047 RepID=UPI003CF6A10D
MPLVRDTLLCDRFLLVDGKLKPALEARFKRSRHATRPESAKDSLGTEDMEGRPFYEPTQELSFVRNLTQGRFTAVLVPTEVANVQAGSCSRTTTPPGGSTASTSSRAPRACSTPRAPASTPAPTRRTRTRSSSAARASAPSPGASWCRWRPAGGHAETALRLDGADAHVDLGDPAALRFGGRAYSVEAWVKPAAPEGPLLGRSAEFQLALDASGALRLTHEGAPAALVATDTLAVDVYTHVAATFDGTTAKLYVNGRPVAGGPLPFTPGARVPVLLGRQDVGGTLRRFSGDVDELRIWNRVRSAAELAEDLGHRLIGNEPGLTAYYRLDEGAGGTAYDQSDNALHGRIEGAVQWTGSDAPIGDHPGVRRDSFVLKGRTVVSGMSAALYHQQENVVSGYRADPKPAKRQARVLLAFAAKYGQEPCLATLDFAVGRDGRLAQAPDVLEPQVLKRPTRGQDSEQISALQQVIKRLEPDIAALPAEIARLSGTAALLPQRLAAQNALQPEYDAYEAAYKAEAVIPGAWLYTLELKTPRVIDGRTVRWVYGEPYRGVSVTGDDGPRTSWALDSADRRSADSLPFRLTTTDAMGYGLLLAASSSNFDYGALGLPRIPFVTPDPRAESYYRFTLIREGDYVRIVNQATGMAIGLPADSKTAALRQAPECRTADTGLFRMTKVRLQWPIDVSFFAVKEKMDAARAAVQESRTASRRIIERQLELATKQAELSAVQDQLASLSSALQGDDDLTLPMPQLAVDATGLSLNGALLEFARGSDRPALLDSGTGYLVLYFRGTDDQFSAVYYDTAVIRGLQTLDGDGGTLGFLARDPALPLDGCVITVSDGDAPGRCDLTVTVGADTETWRSLPRRAAQFAAALAGDPGRPVTVGLVARVNGATVEPAEGTTVALPAKAHLQIGSAGCAVAADTPVGAKTLALTAAATAVQPGDKVSLVGYHWGRAVSTRPGVLLSDGSRLVGLNPGEVEFVPNGTAKPAIAGRGCRWRAEMPGRAFQFSGGDQYLTLPAGKHPGIAPSGDLTLEAWVNPESGQGRVVHARTDDSGYSLSLVPAGLPVKQFAGAEKVVLADSLDLADRDFTIELWAKRSQSRGRTEPLLVHGVPSGVRNQSLHLVLNPSETFRFGLYADDLDTAQAYPDLEWHHWAAVYKNATREQILYRDGVEVGRRIANAPYTGKGPLVIGGLAFGDAYLDGRIDEVRVFDRARTQREIAGDRDRRLSGREPGLLGYWTFEGPAGPPSPIKGYQVVARVGDRVVKSAERFPCNEWAHLAAAFTQSWALRMDNAVGLSVESQDALDLLEDLTIEAFVRIDRTGTPMGLVAKGRAVDGGRSGVPYQFGVLADGRLEFAFAEADGKVVRFASTQALTPGTVQKVSVVRERRQPAPAASGATQPAAPDQPEQYVRFFVGGSLVGNHLYSGPGAQANGSELEIGRGLTGVLGEVRIWSAARAVNQVGLPVTPREKGLLARWAFDENAGNVAFDHSGSFPAKLRGARWTRDPDPAVSPLRLYRNGQPLAEGPVTAQDSAPWGEAQLTLGARLEGGKPADPFTGTLEEVRIWRTVRTAEQISDNLFSRLRGDKQHLLGYWPFDRDSTEPGTTSVRDEGLRGNSLDFSAKRPRILLSTAPISTDTAQVRSASPTSALPSMTPSPAPPARASTPTSSTTPRARRWACSSAATASSGTAAGTWSPATRSAT